MAKEEDKIRAEGVVVEALPGTQFRVRLDNGHEGEHGEVARGRLDHAACGTPEEVPDSLAAPQVDALS